MSDEDEKICFTFEYQLHQKTLPSLFDSGILDYPSLLVLEKEIIIIKVKHY
jgi:hypothetical protein